jgi:hypothetical protein
MNLSKKRFRNFVFVIMTVLFIGGSLISAYCQEELGKMPSFSGGAGTPEDPYLISTAEDLLAFSEVGWDSNYMEASYRLTENIDLGENTWNPVGSNGPPFSGTFDGNGKTITLRKIADSRNMGLFGSTDRRSSIKNLPCQAIEFIISTANACRIPICLEPVSVKKALKLKNHLRGIDFITPNLDELAVLTGMNAHTDKAELMAAQLIKSGVLNVITTLGKEGLCYTNAEGSKYLQIIPTAVADVTGAGDSLTAGFLYGLIKHRNIDKALICGLAAAAVTISSKESVSPLMSEDKIRELSTQCSLHNML